MSDAPPYDCTTSVTATPDGAHYQFDVTALIVDDALAVAIVPSEAGVRVVLDEPNGDSLVAAPSSTVPASPSLGVSGGEALPDPSFSSGPGALTPTSPEFAVAPAPVVAAPAAPAAPSGSSGRAPAIVLPIRERWADAEPANVAGTLVVAVLGAVLWFGARRTVAPNR